MKRLVLAMFCVLATSCGTYEPLQLCDQIPEGGCPLDRGGTCADPYCDALYGCYDGAWKRVEICSENTGGAGGSGGSTSSDGGSGGTGGGGVCDPIQFDHPDETTGCTPDLQSPDCPAEVAGSCPAKACTTGCLDFYLCTTSGWFAVAYCDEDGNFFQAPD